jgi:hypothetical protein
LPESCPRQITGRFRTASPDAGASATRSRDKLTDTRLRLEIFNLLDAKASQIDYYYASRLPGEPASGVIDIHLHPVEPLSLRVTLTTSF